MRFRNRIRHCPFAVAVIVLFVALGASGNVNALAVDAQVFEVRDASHLDVLTATAWAFQWYLVPARLRGMSPLYGYDLTTINQLSHSDYSLGKGVGVVGPLDDLQKIGKWTDIDEQETLARGLGSSRPRSGAKLGVLLFEDFASAYIVFRRIHEANGPEASSDSLSYKWFLVTTLPLPRISPQRLFVTGKYIRQIHVNWQAN